MEILFNETFIYSMYGVAAVLILTGVLITIRREKNHETSKEI